MSRTVDLVLNILKKGDGAQQVKSDLGGLETAAQAAGAAIASYVSVESIKATYEFAKLGAQSLRTKDAFRNISGGAEEAADRLRAMEQATRGALSEQQAMASANQLMQMGLANNADELEQITTAAVRLGTAMGRDASQSIEEFSLLLANTSIPRLDTFGISAGKVRTRIQELQAETEGLSREEAFMTATMEEAALAMERLGPGIDDEALAFERLEATIQNLKIALAEELAPALAQAAEAGELLLSWNTRLRSALDEHQVAMLDTAESYDGYISEMQRAAEAAGYQIDAEGNLVKVLAGGMGVAARQEIVQANYALSESGWRVQQSLSDIAASGIDAHEGMVSASHGVAAAAAAATAATGTVGELSTAASRVAASFGEMTFDDTELWNLAMASGASVEALSELAQHLGIANDAEIAHTLDAYALIEAFGAGAISADALADGFSGLETGTLAAAGAFEGLDAETARAENSLRDTERAADGASSYLARADRSAQGVERGLYGVEQAAGVASSRVVGLGSDAEAMTLQLRDAEAAAGGVADELNNIPTEIDVYVNIHTRGGGDRAGDIEGGGLDFMTTNRINRMTTMSQAPPTASVADVRAGGAITNIRQDNRQYSRGGDTIIVHDPRAAAMVLEERRRGIKRRLERGL